MSRITKEIAHATAVSLLAKKKEKIKTLKELLRIKVSEEVTKCIPKEVMETFKKYPKFFRTNCSTRISCAGFNYEYYTTETLPTLENYPKVNEKEGAKILEMAAKIESLETEYKRLKNEIEVALYQFRTYANVEKEFPEAYNLLPTKTSQALMINISSLRNQIAH